MIYTKRVCVVQLRAVMPVNRSILGEILHADFEACVDAAIESMRQRKPSHVQLKQRMHIQKDWNDYMKGFECIRTHAQRCHLDEYDHYKTMVKHHEALAATKFGVAL